jgi:hypothetical protein
MTDTPELRRMHRQNLINQDFRQRIALAEQQNPRQQPHTPSQEDGGQQTDEGPVAEPQPFDLFRPRTPDHVAFGRVYQEIAGEIANLPEQAREMAAADLEQLSALATRYGSLAAMPPEVRAQYRAIQQRLATIPRGQSRQNAPRPAGPGPLSNNVRPSFWDQVLQNLNFISPADGSPLPLAPGAQNSRPGTIIVR